MKRPRSRQPSGRWCAVAKPDWSRKLAKPVDVGQRRKLRTLHDVRAHLLKIPEERQTNAVWQSITRQILDAAQSGETIDLTIEFALARMTRS
jgi:hypothetical protein